MVIAQPSDVSVDVDCEGDDCVVTERRYQEAELTHIDGMDVDQHLNDFKDGVIKAAEAALRQKARTPTYDPATGCLGNCWCYVTAAERRKNKRWTPWTPARLTATFTFTGGLYSHQAEGNVETRSRDLKGTCQSGSELYA